MLDRPCQAVAWVTALSAAHRFGSSTAQLLLRVCAGSYAQLQLVS